MLRRIYFSPSPPGIYLAARFYLLLGSLKKCFIQWDYGRLKASLLSDAADQKWEKQRKRAHQTTLHNFFKNNFKNIFFLYIFQAIFAVYACSLYSWFCSFSLLFPLLIVIFLCTRGVRAGPRSCPRARADSEGRSPGRTIEEEEVEKFAQRKNRGHIGDGDT